MVTVVIILALITFNYLFLFCLSVFSCSFFFLLSVRVFFSVLYFVPFSLLLLFFCCDFSFLLFFFYILPPYRSPFSFRYFLLLLLLATSLLLLWPLSFLLFFTFSSFSFLLCPQCSCRVSSCLVLWSWLIFFSPRNTFVGKTEVNLVCHVFCTLVIFLYYDNRVTLRSE